MQNAPFSLDALVKGLSEAARRELPSGWHVRPFGSYIQGTLVAGTAIDVALCLDVNADAASLNCNAVQVLAAALTTRTSSFAVHPAADDAPPEAPVRLLAGDFSNGRWLPKQEIRLYHGDVETGCFDLLLRRLLDVDPEARPFVLQVKWLCQRRNFVELGLGGTYQWALLAVFYLQVFGILPSLKTIVSSEADRDTRHTFARPHGRGAGGLLLGFVEFYLDYLRRPHPKPPISLWDGELTVGVEAEGLGVLEGGIPLRQLVEELLLLRSVLSGSSSSTRLSVTETSSSSSAGLRTGFDLPSFPALITPPPLQRRQQRGLSPVREGSRPSTPPGSPHRLALDDVKRQTSQPFKNMPVLPLFSHELQPSPTSGASLKSSASSRPVTPPGLQSAGFAAPLKREDMQSEASQEQLDEEQHLPSRCRWVIDDSWVARRRLEGSSLEAVQLDSSLDGGLGRTGWEKRFSRREYQIRIGKATEEYRRWRVHLARYGPHQDDPRTPRAVEMTTKKAFESAYREWRVKLHSFTTSHDTFGARGDLPRI